METHSEKNSTPERWRQVEELYHAALERAPGDRLAFLQQACAGDPELRGEVESLLSEDVSHEGMLDRPPVLVNGNRTQSSDSQPSSGQLNRGSQLGPYLIEAPIGKGGMGEVWKAHDTRLNRAVAIKRSAERFTDRFEREARVVAALNHPNICHLYDVGPDYLVMEFIEGAPLKGRCPSIGP